MLNFRNSSSFKLKVIPFETIVWGTIEFFYYFGFESKLFWKLKKYISPNSLTKFFSNRKLLMKLKINPAVSKPLKIDENYANISVNLGYSTFTSISTFSKLTQKDV